MPVYHPVIISESFQVHIQACVDMSCNVGRLKAPIGFCHWLIASHKEIAFAAVLHMHGPSVKLKAAYFNIGGLAIRRLTHLVP